MSESAIRPIYFNHELSELPPGVVLKTEENCRDKSLLKWSGELPIPIVGERVTTYVNALGSGVVESYFFEHGYVGVIVKLDAPPKWHQIQCKGTKSEGIAMVFGSELKLREVTDV